MVGVKATGALFSRAPIPYAQSEWQRTASQSQFSRVFYVHRVSLTKQAEPPPLLTPPHCSLSKPTNHRMKMEAWIQCWPHCLSTKADSSFSHGKHVLIISSLHPFHPGTGKTDLSWNKINLFHSTPDQMRSREDSLLQWFSVAQGIPSPSITSYKASLCLSIQSCKLEIIIVHTF